jgi:outer membrane protein OmpA-like peptidoglycan-associated protein
MSQNGALFKGAQTAKRGASLHQQSRQLLLPEANISDVGSFRYCHSGAVPINLRRSEQPLAKNMGRRIGDAMSNAFRTIAVTACLAAGACAGPPADMPSEARFLVFFEEFGARIGPDGNDIVRQAASAALKRHTTAIRIEARANATGSADATMKIAETRAAVVRDMLISDGVLPSTLRLVPIGQNGTQDTGVAPRRVDIILEN